MNTKGLDQLGRCRSDQHGYSAALRSEGPKRVGRGVPSWYLGPNGIQKDLS
jgi:hypothetical protein